MQTSILGIGYAYDSHLSYLDHLRIADAAREAGVVAGEAADRGARRVEAGIAAAASQVTSAVNDLSADVRAASEIMEWGFSAMLNEMAEMRTTLKELLRCVREPSQTWAYEQFDIARDNFRKGNYEDCLRRLGYAIDGYQTHLGYPEEWRLHQLRGDIYLQCRDRSLIDLPKGEKSFVAAAKYADTSHAKAMALTAAAVAAYNQGRMDVAEKYAQKACEARGNLADAHFQLARVRLNRQNYSDAWKSALRAITLDHRYAARLPLDSEFRRNAAGIKPAWTQYAKDLKARLETTPQRVAATMKELAKSREATNRMRHSRAFELLDLAGSGLAEAKARFQKMTELVDTLSPQADKAMKLVADGLRGNSVFTLLEAEPYALRANDLATRALAASREAKLTIQKVENLSQRLPPKPKVFLPEAVCIGFGIVGLFASVMVIVGIVYIARWVVGYHDKEGILASIIATLFYLALALGFWSCNGWVNSKASYKKLIERFDWHAANAPQTTAAADGTILGSDGANGRSVERDLPAGLDPDSLEGRIVSLLWSGDRIGELEAIKLYRKETGCDLQTARDFLDALAPKRGIL